MAASFTSTVAVNPWQQKVSYPTHWQNVTKILDAIFTPEVNKSNVQPIPLFSDHPSTAVDPLER